jgi:hypothetical protein
MHGLRIAYRQSKKRHYHSRINYRSEKALRLILSILLLIGALPRTTAESSQTVFTLDAPGIALKEPDTMLVAARLNNTSNRTAFNVQIDSFHIDPNIWVLQTRFPVEVGDVAAQHNAVVQANFKSNQLISGQKYVLVIKGTYLSENRQDRQKASHGFTASVAIVLPHPAPEPASVHTGAIAPHQVSGAPFPPQPPKFDERVNGSRWTVPTDPGSK